MTGSNGAGEGHGASVRRVEDPPFLRGTRPYTDDLRENGALYAVFVRAGSAHATINDIENVEIVFKDGVGYDSEKLIQSVQGLVGIR